METMLLNWKNAEAHAIGISIMVLSERKQILLEEYKNCTQVFLNESRLFWTRFGVYLAISSGLLTAWSYLGQLNRTPFLSVGLLAISLIGAFLGIIWFFVVGRGNALSDLCQDRLREIERDLKTLKTFDEYRERSHFDGRKSFERGRLRNTSLWPPALFTLIWTFLSVLSLLQFQLQT
jgi:hypothetical protein